MGVELDFLVLADEGTSLFDGFVDGRRGGGSGSVFECDAVKRNVAGEDLVEAVDVELRGVRVLFVEVRREAHHGDGDLVFETVFRDCFTGDVEVADVVERVEVADGGHAVFLEEFGMEVDDIAGLGGEADDVDAAGEGLEVDVRTDGRAPLVHHFKGVFLAVEVEALEAGAAADFDVGDAGFDRGFESGKEVVGFDTGAEAGLESVTERAVHEFDFFCHCVVLSKVQCFLFA